MVAQDLLGKYLIRETEKSKLIAKIIEVEAYVGPEDKASHSYNYRKTERTKIMYEKPGTLYVYLIYGMYNCLNVVTEPEGVPCAVLIRQLYPIKGIELMKENRNVKLGKDYKNLLDGPGKLCIALDINKNNFNGRDSCSPKSQLYFSRGETISKDKIISEKRIGIDYAGEDKDRLLRFMIAD
ncbi:MAG: DNA-3-methyladenine glycosylase [Candidatus Lokiarchaeota archaeon]|nr:DNA-3-methyladenine glycosylase [Candidatus Lokiarchaeota archaeon]MBD3211255.1 DNA-3-methyladenine glycosylase [Candidatus Lokiarchaeota archaeon]